jgi:digeranylgeranylglycerophospholipid reductase
VLVVGGGPAGTITSLICANHGLNTVLLEKNSEIGQHTKTKLDASADNELKKIIDELDLKTENEVYSSKWHPPSGNFFLLKSSSPEYFFKRGPENDSFEATTAKRAHDSGCEILLNSKIERVKEVEKRIGTIVVKKGNKTIQLKPKIIVAADGANSLFHKFVFKRSENRKKVGYGVTGKGFSDIDTSNVYFNAESIPGGYFYLITGKSGVSSGSIVLDSLHMKHSAKRYFETFLKENKSLAEKLKTSTNYFGGDGPIFDIDRYVSKNLIFVGDAAGLIDPFFGYGMASAIISGYYAGSIINDTLADNNFDLLQKYDQTIKEKFNKRLSYLYQRVFESLNNDDLDMISEILNELNRKTDIDVILRKLSGE